MSSSTGRRHLTLCSGGPLLAACGQAAGRAGQGAASPATGRLDTATATQTNEGGQVTVQVTWQGPSAGPVFSVVLDTHSGDLDGYDLKQLASLRTASGREVRPLD